MGVGLTSTSDSGSTDVGSWLDQNAKVGDERPSDTDESSDDEERLGAAVLDKTLRLIDWRLFWNQIVTDLSSLYIGN